MFSRQLLLHAGLLDHVTVLIGVAVNGEAVAGVIHQPYFNYQSKEPGIELGRTIWGIVGLGWSCPVNCCFIFFCYRLFRASSR